MDVDFDELRGVIKKVFRIVEVLAGLLFLRWASVRVPLAASFFRRLLTLVLGHSFIFLVGNLIVLTLFLKSRTTTTTTTTTSHPQLDPNQFFHAHQEDKQTLILEPTTTTSQLRSDQDEQRFTRRCTRPEELSSEEFKKQIEAFIARQTQFHRQEKLAIVLHGTAPP